MNRQKDKANSVHSIALIKRQAPSQIQTINDKITFQYVVTAVEATEPRRSRVKRGATGLLKENAKGRSYR